MPQLSRALLEMKLSGRQSFPHQGWMEASSKLCIPTENSDVSGFSALVCFPPRRGNNSPQLYSFFFFNILFYPLLQPASIIPCKNLNSLKARRMDIFRHLWIFSPSFEKLGHAAVTEQGYNPCCSQPRRKNIEITLMDSLSNCSLR